MSFKSNFLIVSLTVLTIASPDLALADKVTCESKGYDRDYCEMDTRGGVRVYKNLSKTDCIDGDNWGEGRHGIWVERGCRAIFVSRGGDDFDRDEHRHDGDRHDDNDRHHDNDRPRGDYRREPAPLNCPPGTRPNNHRCTAEERRRGCKDYGANDGTGRGCSNF